MDREAVDAFLALARAGHYGDAAGALHIAQPSLSRRIQRLESTLGVRLFDRGRHGARLSTAGRDLAPLIESWVAADDLLRRQAGLVESGVVGTLRLGFGMSSIEIAPQAVARYRRRFPEVAVVIDDMSSVEQIERLNAGLLDAAFVRSTAADNHPQLHGRQVGRDRLALARPSGERTASVSALLSGRPLIALDPGRGPGLHQQLIEWSQAHRQPIDVSQRAQDLLTVLALVAADAGVAIVPASARRAAPRGVIVTPLPGPAVSWTVSLVWRSDAVSPALREFLDAATESN